LATTAQQCHVILHDNFYFSGFLLIPRVVGEKGRIKDIYSRGYRN